MAYKSIKFFFINTLQLQELVFLPNQIYKATVLAHN
jgi:hypothetical protein